ncbi:histidine phosphatase family protein [Neobacillus sp. LXY-4]|uniref:histidine phosphatase family protein n=1 Tax=Neobacillus sp. LXY-4 TaxID=3379826 RepID=UPI003EE3DE9D
MLNLYLTRHGQTEWNIQKRLQGWGNSALTKQGIQNAVALGEKLKEVRFDAVYSSTSNRTIETAKLIIGEKQLHINTDENLREMGLGEWEGKTHQEIKERHPEQFINFWENPVDYQPVGGETFHDLSVRAMSVLNKIISSHTTGNILIVTHTVVLKSLLMQVKGNTLADLWEPPYIHDTSLTILECKEGDLKVMLEGDISHLDQAIKV